KVAATALDGVVDVVAARLDYVLPPRNLLAGFQPPPTRETGPGFFGSTTVARERRCDHERPAEASDVGGRTAGESLYAKVRALAQEPLTVAGLVELLHSHDLPQWSSS